MKKSLILITGCDTGIGKALVERYLEAGHSVVATYLDLSNHTRKENVYPLQVDQTKESDIQLIGSFLEEKCFEKFELSTAILNAGVAHIGPVEDLPFDRYRNEMEINFFGTVKITQLIIPYLRDSRGKVAIHSSLAGKVALPFFSPYTASKFALEGFSQSLRGELQPFGIKVIVLNTGAIATPIWNKGKAQDMNFVSGLYKRNITLILDKMILNGNNGITADTASRMIFKVISKRNPPLNCHITGTPIIDKLTTLLPLRLTDWIISKMFSQK